MQRLCVFARGLIKLLKSRIDLSATRQRFISELGCLVYRLLQLFGNLDEHRVVTAIHYIAACHLFEPDAQLCEGFIGASKTFHQGLHVVVDRANAVVDEFVETTT